MEDEGELVVQINRGKRILTVGVIDWICVYVRSEQSKICYRSAPLCIYVGAVSMSGQPFDTNHKDVPLT